MDVCGLLALASCTRVITCHWSLQTCQALPVQYIWLRLKGMALPALTEPRTSWAVMLPSAACWLLSPVNSM